MSLASVSQLEWDIVFNALSEEQRSRVFELALRIMPLELPEPGDLEAIEEGEEENFVFTSPPGRCWRRNPHPHWECSPYRA
jgi:hypothetical protein